MSGSIQHSEPGAAAGEPKNLSAPQQAPAPATDTIKLSRTQLPEVLQLMPPWIKWPEYSKVRAAGCHIQCSNNECSRTAAII